jgi:hypothetical protein
MKGWGLQDAYEVTQPKHELFSQLLTSGLIQSQVDRQFYIETCIDIFCSDISLKIDKAFLLAQVEELLPISADKEAVIAMIGSERWNFPLELPRWTAKMAFVDEEVGKTDLF